MDHENNIKEPKVRLLPGKVSLTGAAILSCLMTVASAVSFCTHDLIASMLAFIAASALLSFFLVFVRKPYAVVLPVISAAAGILLGCDALAVSAVVCGVTVFAVVYTVCHLKLLESFRQFMVTALLYSLAGGGLFCLIIRSVYGSVGGGIVAFGNRVVSYMTVLAESASIREGVDYNTVNSLISALFENSQIYLPAVIASMGIICAWTMRGIFSMYTRISGIPSLFGGRQTSAPRALAVLFLIVSIFGVFFSALPEPAFFALSNIRSIISAVFLGEGVRFLLIPAKKRVAVRIHPSIVMGLLILVFFFPIVLPLILPYYGAFAVIRERRREKI